MHSSSKLHLAMALAVVASFPACQCQRQTAIETPIAELQPCEENERCETGLCDSANGNPKACLRPCAQGCRGADICTRLPTGEYACVPERAGLCKQCQSDSDCPQAADRCLQLGDETFCGRDCSFDDQCPSGYRCGEATTVTGALAPKQCQPSSGTCDCIPATAGQQIPCQVTNASGTCSGISVCRPPIGYDTCTARTPTAEACNNIDDDCNGMTDEGLGDLTCGVGDCVRAVAACANGTAQICTPGLPGSEVCNGRDDNCNGTVDDGFNLQTDVANCGACGTVCVLTNAVPVCNAGVCAVDRCTPGWTDLDHVAANGCEYPCTPTDGGMEICDGLDNDCDGVVDDGFDLINDPLNCGQCNLACSVPGTTVSTYACVARVCGIGMCVPGRGNCNQQYGDGCEVNLGTEVNHCGACGNACSTPNGTPGCDGGMCNVAQCNTGFANCDLQVQNGCEVNTQNSVSNCGTCGNVCDAANASDSCINGVCSFACAANFWDADGLASNGCEYACIRTAGGVEQCDGIDNDCDNRIDEDFDLTSNASHCGQCNRACSAPFATTTCSASTCAVTACNTGRANCNSAYVDGCEVNTGTDVANCGTCNNACTAANGTPRCTGGSCGIASCNTGFANCNNQVGDGCEVNTNTSLTNCGSCGNMCSAANGSANCLGGTCGVAACNAGFANCNMQASDGCEVTTSTDLNNCGSCGAVCNPSHSTARCALGSCGFSSCDQGYSNCNGTVSDGCEVLTGGSDLNNCGGCGAICATANATPRCTTGTCGIQSCNLGFANCNNQVNDGCEVNTNTSLTNCGACNNACSAANGTASCVGGACGVASCNTGFANCNGSPADGCEVNTRNNVNNCGACNVQCSAANGTPSCASGTCGISSCNPGFTNCNGLAADGCEVQTGGSDLNNCGGCGTLCSTPNATPACTTGTCGISSCNLGFANCNNQVNDGCEVNTTNSLANCGACGALCAPNHANPVCVAGTCGIGSCQPGYVNANGLVADGCEYLCVPSNGGIEACDGLDNDCDGVVDENFTLATDVNNCGTCGFVCSAPNVTVPRCNAGTCGVQQCGNGFANCNGSFSDGCEVNTNTSVSSCGTCGNACSVANGTPACVTGTCAIASCTGSNRDCVNGYADGCETNVAGNVNACGLCGNVCPARANAGRTCSGTTCGYACNPGFVDLDGDASNGCEYVCTASGNDDPDDGSADQDCDGIDGSVSKGIFVSLTGSDSNPGTRALPKRTVQAAINAGSAVQPHVYVSTGTYDEAITLRSGISVFGGYSPTTWARSSANVVTIRSGAPSGSNIIAMQGTNITAATTVAYVTVSALSTSSPGVSVYGLHCSNCTGLTVRTSLIMAGSAGSGTAGGSGSAGAAGFNGTAGADGSCDGASGGGGTGGSSTCGRTGGNGGAGGPEGANDGATGGTGVVGVPGGGGGLGGGNNCNLVCGSCDPITGGGNGTSGGAGANGTNGGAGSGGAVVASFFVASGGGNGGTAGHGNGGGGGGGGGGQGGNCNNDGGGNGGGGGGAGGCAGTAANGGTGGGSSIGVFLLNSTGAVFVGNTISSANGGNGGAGGAGGSGGAGGFGASGATACTGEVGRGGNGGNGGAGGRGGHGGGGAGGVSYGIYRSGSTVTLTGNAVTNGNGGFGGASSGNVGINGAQGTVF